MSALSLNILLATMQLDIGGAETHIIELAKSLKARGHSVFIASGGGVYEEELKKYDIPHFCVALNSKNPISVLSSMRKLSKIIDEQKIDIVHSHARIPSFIINKIHKKKNFAFVTTAHGAFSTKYGLKYITSWGEKSIAVSDDLKEYLVRNYNYPEKDITVTINGIDTDFFCPEVSDSDKKEKTIVHVCRMDTRVSLVAHLLIKAFETGRIDRDVRLMIVGGGNDYENVLREANLVNGKLGYDAISLTGALTDVKPILNKADLFVGVSRAALEAMACERPSILAGAEGTLGLFYKEKLDDAIKTNFCCRGLKEASVDSLTDDINNFFSLSNEEQNSIGKYSRTVVKEYYSVKKMTDDTLFSYSEVLKERIPKKVLISGYYGFNNNGDDALLYSIISDLKNEVENVEITVLSNNPEETKKLYGVNSISRTAILKILSLMERNALFISGGGTLIQDSTSTKSLIYYLTLIRLAKMKKMRVSLFANGIGTLKKCNEKRVSKVLNKVDSITLRDEIALMWLKKINVSRPFIKLTADPVFALDALDKTEGKKYLESFNINSDSIAYFCMRFDKKSSPSFCKEIAKCADELSKEGYFPVFIPFQSNKDTKICEEIQSLMNEKSEILVLPVSPYLSLSVFSCGKVCVGMRLHSLIYAFSQNVPVTGIVYDTKVKGFMDYTGLDSYINTEDVTSEKLLDLIKKSIERKSPYDCEKFSLLAHENVKIALNIKEGIF